MTVGTLSVDCPSMRWTRPEQWHLTLAFLGEVDDRTRGALADRLASIASQTAPFTLAVASAGRFGHRVLWAAVRGDMAELHRLASLMRAAAQSVGLSTEERPYQPHLTLAITDGDVDLGPAVAALASFESSPWAVGELRVMCSRWAVGPSHSPPLYETLGTWPIIE